MDRELLGIIATGNGIGSVAHQFPFRTNIGGLSGPAEKFASIKSSGELYPITLEKLDGPCISIGNADRLDGMSVRHIQCERMRWVKGHVECNGSIAPISNYKPPRILNPFIRLRQMANYRLFGRIDDFVSWQIDPVLKFHRSFQRFF